jgi:hypothetical protein
MPKFAVVKRDTRRHTRADRDAGINILKRQVWAIRRCRECQKWYIGVRNAQCQQKFVMALFCSPKCESDYWRPRVRGA